MRREKYLLNYSRQLRNKSTVWEQKLWRHLRAGRFYGLKFKRQVPIQGCIVDFCCNEKKLIIELDGYYHKFSLDDDCRDRCLKNLGYTVLRFWNNEIEKKILKRY